MQNLNTKKSPQLRLWEDVRDMVRDTFGQRAVETDTGIRVQGIGSSPSIDLSECSYWSDPGAVFYRLTVTGLYSRLHSDDQGTLEIRVGADGKTSYSRERAFRNVSFRGESKGKPYTMAQIRDAVDEAAAGIRRDIVWLEAFGDDAGSFRRMIHYWSEKEGFSLPVSDQEQVELARKIEVANAFDLYRRFAHGDGMSEEAVEKAVKNLSDPVNACWHDFITPYLKWKLEEIYGEYAESHLRHPGSRLSDTRYFLYPLGSDGKQAKGEK